MDDSTMRAHIEEIRRNVVAVLDAIRDDRYPASVQQLSLDIRLQRIYEDSCGALRTVAAIEEGRTVSMADLSRFAQRNSGSR